MLPLSARGLTLPPSPYRKLTPFAEAARRRGLTVHPLNIGQPDIETPPQMVAALQQADIGVLEYGPAAGNASYRQTLADYYQRQGLAVEADDIIVTTGGSEAIAFALLACLDPGDEFIVPEPFYGPYEGFAVTSGTRLVPVASYLEDDFALPPISAFEACLTPRTRAILICSPNNPTGYVYSRAELEQLLNLCQRHNLYLLADEAYREFCYDGTFTSALELAGAGQHVVLLDTISKRYSACGARIGAFVTKNQALRDVVFKLAQLRVCPPALGQLLAEAAADLPADYFDHTKAEYQARRDLMVARLRAMPGVRCPQPRGAFYVLCHLPVDDAGRFCQWLLEEFDLHGETLMASPAAGFYATAGLGRQQVRLAYVVSQDIISRAMNCLAVALQQYPGRQQ